MKKSKMAEDGIRRSTRILSKSMVQKAGAKRSSPNEKYSYYFENSQTPDSKRTFPSRVKKIKKSNHCRRLGRTFFDQYAPELAKHLLGKRLCRVLEDGEVISGRIVETEGYLGESDKACHTFGGKQTSRTEAMYMDPGTVYVYFIYGIQTMSKFRSQKRNSSNKPLKNKELCNGPSKLCQAMAITKKSLNKEDLVTSNVLWIEDEPEIEASRIVVTKRIGIDSYGKEASEKPLRFYELGNPCVSARDKSAEKIIMGSK